MELLIAGYELEGVGELTINELRITLPIEVTGGVGSILFYAHPVLWNPDNPKPYDVTITYQNDIIHEKIGFREIRVEGTHILLNGSEIFLKGISTHEESVLNWNAISEEEIIENFNLVTSASDISSSSNLFSNE